MNDGHDTERATTVLYDKRMHLTIYLHSTREIGSVNDSYNDQKPIAVIITQAKKGCYYETSSTYLITLYFDYNL